MRNFTTFLISIVNWTHLMQQCAHKHISKAPRQVPTRNSISYVFNFKSQFQIYSFFSWIFNNHETIRFGLNQSKSEKDWFHLLTNCNQFFDDFNLMIVLINKEKQIQPFVFYPFVWILNCFNLKHLSNKELVEN
jgi:hypothetical protein